MAMDGYMCPDLTFAAKSGMSHKTSFQFVLATCTTLQNVLPRHLQPKDCASQADIELFIKTTNVLMKTSTDRFDVEKFMDAKTDSYLPVYSKSQWSLFSSITQDLTVQMRRTDTHVNTNWMYQGALGKDKELWSLGSKSRTTNNGR
jgi:hypothetical protein